VARTVLGASSRDLTISAATWLNASELLPLNLVEPVVVRDKPLVVDLGLAEFAQDGRHLLRGVRAVAQQEGPEQVQLGPKQMAARNSSSMTAPRRPMPSNEPALAPRGRPAPCGIA
jgi:hypothetical protein